MLEPRCSFFFMRVADPSCLPPLPSMQWLSSLFSTAQVPLPFFDFHISKSHGFRLCSPAGNVLQRRSSALSSFRQNYIFPPKLYLSAKASSFFYSCGTLLQQSPNTYLWLVLEPPATGFSCCNLSFASCEVRCNLP